MDRQNVKYQQVKEIAWTAMGDEIVILDSRGDRHFHELNPIGSFLWKKMDQPLSLVQLKDAVIDEYEVESNQAKLDVEAFLDQLSKFDLVQRQQSQN